MSPDLIEPLGPHMLNAVDVPALGGVVHHDGQVEGREDRILLRLDVLRGTRTTLYI